MATPEGGSVSSKASRWTKPRVTSTRWTVNIIGSTSSATPENLSSWSAEMSTGQRSKRAVRKPKRMYAPLQKLLKAQNVKGVWKALRAAGHTVHSKRKKTSLDSETS